MMATLAERGVTHLALEASSHGIDQRRLDGVRLTAAGFLNLSQDHLDYHGTMGVYRAAKLRLFETLLPRGGAAVLNADSDAYSAFAAAAVLNGHTVMSVGAKGQGLTLTASEPTARGQRLSVSAWGAPTRSPCRSPAHSRPPTPWSRPASASPPERASRRCWPLSNTSKALPAGCNASAKRPAAARPMSTTPIRPMA